MKLRKLAGTCDDGTCPNVYLSDRDTLVLQGDAVLTADGLAFGPGEQAVELSVDLVEEALRALGR
ncbi:hypothetical protein SAMN05421837_106234 [Amycolatopsis pretoriensis]|uniref:Uncharacterized protein n=1 Tax=Amycolatopsis pretoriensis TaxID=218821 RepID=A0A1H5R4W3_9PSEU|nr:hypothetical protein [Amycolatopsis pretoriensis]SEF32437.1 hypothetical protein SAMN05421837_106234 [Amycolatopsis pretoriensis]